MRITLIRLAYIHYDIGIIDYNELKERIDVALWLTGEQKEFVKDPRADSEEDLLPNETGRDENESVITTIEESKNKSSGNDENRLCFLLLGSWKFTKSDPDSYPSVPHGHFKNQNKKWPKLNPYTGRVFAARNQEDTTQLLSKKQMRDIWSNEKFKRFCIDMIYWYLEEKPHYKFPVRNPLLMPTRWNT